MELLDELRRGRRGAMARAISMVENDPAGARRMLRKIYPETGGSLIVGMTGPAGAGKSSLIDRLAGSLSEGGSRPAVLAVDPTSHLSGGAMLGDRVRMSGSTDSGVYIRSLASRGATGAVSPSLRDSIRVLEYAGCDTIIVESVGAGQTEVGISSIADVTVVVFNPHTGDSIQAIKAGITEIGDIYVVNKSDLPGAARLYDAVRDHAAEGRGAPVLKTSAKRGTGIARLAGAIRAAADAKGASGPERDLARLRAELKDIVLNGVSRRIDELLESDAAFAGYPARMLAKKLDPYRAADRLAGALLR